MFGFANPRTGIYGATVNVADRFNLPGPLGDKVKAAILGDGDDMEALGFG